MSAVDSFREDAAECLRLSELTTRTSIKMMLAREAEKFTTLAKEAEEKAVLKAAKTSGSFYSRDTFATKITNYGWDQSDKFVKLYVTLNEVQVLAPENITTTFQAKSVELRVIGLNNKSYSLLIKNLLHPIKPEDSYHKVKTDMVVVFLKKSKPDHWACVTESEQKTKDLKAPKMDEGADPSQSLMNLMKQMYDEGDDEMKRNIAKAWTEAREKKVEV